MSDFDLDRLGDVWRQQPDPAEIARLQRTALLVSRRARWAQFIDAGAALAVGAVVLALVLSNPQADTFLMGGAAILVLLFSHVRQRRLRQVEIRELAGGTEEMLDQSIARVESTLKRARFSFLTLLPSFLLGLVIASVADGRSLQDILPRSDSELWLRLLWIGGVFFVIAVGIYLAVALRRSSVELQRLVAMREAYREETESSTAD